MYDEVGAIHIDKVIVYKEQIKGEVFRKDFRPPQSFYYLSDEEYDKIQKIQL